MTVSQSVPLTLLSSANYESFKEPSLPDPEVFIFMPMLKVVRTLIERMKNQDDYITIEANMGGELTFKVSTSASF